MSLGRLAEAPPGGLTEVQGGGAGWRSPVHEPHGFAPVSLARAMARGALDDLATTLFPGDCRVCRGALLRFSRVPVCSACLESPRPQRGSLCGICGDALGFESERMGESLAHGGAVMCTPCRLAPPPFLRAAAFGVYQGELRELLHLLKYDGLRRLSRPLGSMLAQAMKQVLAGTEPGSAGGSAEVLIVPVPLFRDRRRERGFNQVELLAAEALRELRANASLPKLRLVPEALTRRRATAEQFGLNPSQRRRNLRGAFAADRPELVQDREILLVDDIFTTGATARACAAVLQRAGARRVLVATLARAQTETVALWDGGVG